MKYAVKLYLMLVLLGGIKITAQNPLSLYYLENIPQTTLLNPAMIPRTNFFMGVPGINTLYTNINSDISSGLIQEKDGEIIPIGSDEYDYSGIFKSIGEAANITAIQSMAPLMFGFRTKHGYFTFSWTEKLGEELSIPKDVFEIMDKGYLKGSTYNLNLLGTDAHYYREISLGYSFQSSKYIRFGIHAKFLQGLVAIKSDIKNITLKVGTDESDISLNGSVYMSAPVYVSYDDNGLPVFDSIPKDLNSFIDKGIFNFSNPGFALDMGFVYSKNKIEVSAALNDLGFISWKGDDANKFYANGNYTFSTLGDSLDTPIKDLIDSIKIAVNFSHKKVNFMTITAPKLYFGAAYHITDYFNVGLLSRTVFSKYVLRQEFNLSANMNFHHLLTTSINYTLTVNGVNSLGAGAALRLGPLQVYTALDYIPDKIYKNVTIGNEEAGKQVTMPVIPDRYGNFSLMFGVNILFGANGFHDKPMIEPSPLF